MYTYNKDTSAIVCQWIQSYKYIHISTFSYIHKEAYMSSTIHHVYKTFVQHIITSFDIYRHTDISTLLYMYIQHSTSTHYLLHSTFISNFVELLRCSSWNITYVIRHYLTLFYFIWHNLISFFICFCQCLSNVLIHHGGRSDVEYRSNMSKGACGFIIRLNSTKFAGATIFSRTSDKK